MGTQKTTEQGSSDSSWMPRPLPACKCGNAHLRYPPYLVSFDEQRNPGYRHLRLYRAHACCQLVLAPSSRFGSVHLHIICLGWASTKWRCCSPPDSSLFHLTRHGSPSHFISLPRGYRSAYTPCSNGAAP